MKPEVVQSHYFECAGVEMHKTTNVQRTLPVVMKIFRNGVTEVLCHALKDDLCTAVSVPDSQPAPRCTYLDTPAPLQKSTSANIASEVSLTETNINSVLIRKMNDAFDVKSLGDVVKTDFGKILMMRGAGPQMIKTLLVELKTRGLKIRTEKTKMDLKRKFHGEWAALMDDTIEFGVSSDGTSSSSS